jgi:acyl-CoA thioester hydrolase
MLSRTDQIVFDLDIHRPRLKNSTVMTEAVFRREHRVTYAECTLGNHVYYARYLDMLEDARGEFFRRAGIPLLALQEGGTTFPVVEVNIKYKGPARYDDVVTIELWISEMKGARLNFGFRILHSSGHLLAEGQTFHFCASVDEKPKRISKELMERFQQFVCIPNEAG